MWSIKSIAAGAVALAAVALLSSTTRAVGSGLQYFGYWRDTANNNYICQIQDHANFSMIEGDGMQGLANYAASYGIANWGLTAPSGSSPAQLISHSSATTPIRPRMDGAQRTRAPTASPMGGLGSRARSRPPSIRFSRRIPTAPSMGHQSGGRRRERGSRFPDDPQLQPSQRRRLGGARVLHGLEWLPEQSQRTQGQVAAACEHQRPVLDPYAREYRVWIR